MKSDIDIAREAKLLDVDQIRRELNIQDDEYHPYGRHKGKVSLKVLDRLKENPDGKLVVVTAITPTKYGEGKTTTSIGLTMGMNRIGKKTIVALREPSLGPVFGMKGGAAGGGFSQVLPMEDINLHFTGDIHAITTAHNLLSAVIGNHLHYTNELNIDSRKITWTRAIDMNDRSLRDIVVGLGGKKHGYPDEDSFIISAASEVMAILTLSQNIGELKRRMCDIIIGFSRKDDPVYAGNFKVCGAMATVLKDAIMPNLVQTIDNTPAFIHGGPFANISFGTNSVVATKMALKLSDYVVTECGFGSDLGFEKFANLVSRIADYRIHAVVIVATVRALKHQGGGKDAGSLQTGLANLGKHISNIRNMGFKPVVAVNAFPDDTPEELETVKQFSEAQGAVAAVSNGFLQGGEGATALAEKVVQVADGSSGDFTRTYEMDDLITDKITKVATAIYGADGVIYSWEAKKKLKLFEKLGLERLPICIAKTPLSFSDNKNKPNVPSGWRLNINDINIATGAGYAIPISGDIMLMPGLPKVPSAEHIDIDDTGEHVSGLF